ncbi:MAG: fibronectin type III domain-containing protein, partial [Pseudomonadales bacterium]
APTPAPAPAPAPAPVTGSASLSWSIPTKRENGESLALSEIASYEIYVTAENAGTSRTIRVDNRNQTKYTLSPLDSDKYFFSMVTIDSEGMYSELSQVVSKTIN